MQVCDGGVGRIRRADWSGVTGTAASLCGKDSKIQRRGWWGLSDLAPMVHGQSNARRRQLQNNGEIKSFEPWGNGGTCMVKR